MWPLAPQGAQGEQGTPLESFVSLEPMIRRGGAFECSSHLKQRARWLELLVLSGGGLPWNLMLAPFTSQGAFATILHNSSAVAAAEMPKSRTCLASPCKGKIVFD